MLIDRIKKYLDNERGRTMYTTAFIVERIKEMLKATNKKQKDVLLSAGANVNLLNQASDKKGFSVLTLAAIADELGCSVDYLLGREMTNAPIETNRDELISILNQLSEPELDELIRYAEFLLSKR